MEAQQLALAAAAAELPPAAATEALALQHQQHQQHHRLQQPAAQMASWPLPVVPGAHTGLSAEDAAARGLMAGGSGLPLHGLSDASLPLPGVGWGARRLSGQSAGGSSFTRKREKVLMGLPTVQDGLITGTQGDEQATDRSGRCVPLQHRCLLSLLLCSCSLVVCCKHPALAKEQTQGCQSCHHHHTYSLFSCVPAAVGAQVLPLTLSCVWRRQGRLLSCPPSACPSPCQAVLRWPRCPPHSRAGCQHSAASRAHSQGQTCSI